MYITLNFGEGSVTQYSRYPQDTNMSSGKVAVVLSGCGVYDGTEVHEAAAVCSALTRQGKKVVFYAPSKDQYQEINHTNGGNTTPGERNVLVESARIARGKVNALDTLTVDDYEALVIPGGFGAAKNLCTYAVSETPEVDPDLRTVLNSFREAGKPIAMCCIAPILAAMVLCSKDEGKSVKLTLGRREASEAEAEAGMSWPYSSSAMDKAADMGATVEEAGVEDFVVDEENRVFTTPAFMCDGAPFHLVHDGIEKMVKAMTESLAP